MAKRLFTVEEQKRLEIYSEKLARTFMWSGYVSSNEKFKKMLKRLFCIAVPAIIIVALLTYFITSMFFPDDTIWLTCLFSIFTLMIVGTCVMGTFVDDEEKEQITPPVIIFFNDKLYYIEFDDNHVTSETQKKFLESIPKIKAGELFALRQETNAYTANLSNRQLQAIIFYLNAIDNIELGTDTQDIKFKVIDNILDVDVDTHDPKYFVITYEDDEEERKLSLPLDKWKELYEWLLHQNNNNE